jgi:excisionase family DNA binding protein
VENLNRYLKVAEAAQFPGIAQNTLRSWADRGEVPATKTPSGYRLFRERDLQAFLKKTEKPLDRRPKSK